MKEGVTIRMFSAGWIVEFHQQGMSKSFELWPDVLAAVTEHFGQTQPGPEPSK